MVERIAEFVPEKVKALVLDADDTATRGTQDIKTAAWEELFHDKLDKLVEARELYERSGAGDRYNMIAHIIDEPQGSCRDNENVKNFAGEFEELIQTK
ncbi:MAG: hypothetical protein AAFO91_05100, partial [Bacteroidota bacterium]